MRQSLSQFSAITRTHPRWLRKSRVRATSGASKICAGGPCSMIAPRSNTTTRSATRRAKRHLMRHDDHRHALVGQALHDVQHFADRFGIERRGRFVEQHHLGLHRQRAGDGDALLLAARQIARDSCRALSASPTLSSKRLARAVGRRRAPGAARSPGPIITLAKRGPVRKQLEVLEHHAHPPAHLRACRPVGAAEVRRPAGSRRRRSSPARWCSEAVSICPEPDGPIRHTTSPLRTCIDTPSSATKSPNSLRTSR